ncbi:YdcF family protein [Ottowia thiooxydans]|uniref:YdcF family protein n=1 Tax=Ottowia thiooxydans TaxID=219182 RepID=UPI00339AF043
MAATSLLLLGLGLAPLIAGNFHLGVAVPMVLGAGGLWLAWQWQAVRRWRAAAPWRRWLWRAGWSALAAWTASVVGLWMMIAGMGFEPQATPRVAAMVVLGSGTQDGHPRAPLALRLDTAAELAAAQPDAIVAVSGGVDFGEKESEGIIMARYLAANHGLRQSAVVVEEVSTSTELNLALTRPLLEQRGVDLNQPIAVVTSDFHLWRALRIAKRQGYVQPVGVGAPTPLIIRFNVWLREYFAVASSWALGEW